MSQVIPLRKQRILFVYPSIDRERSERLVLGLKDVGWTVSSYCCCILLPTDTEMEGILDKQDLLVILAISPPTSTQIEFARMAVRKNIWVATYARSPEFAKPFSSFTFKNFSAAGLFNSKLESVRLFSERLSLEIADVSMVGQPLPSFAAELIEKARVWRSTNFEPIGLLRGIDLARARRREVLLLPNYDEISDYVDVSSWEETHEQVEVLARKWISEKNSRAFLVSSETALRYEDWLDNRPQLGRVPREETERFVRLSASECRRKSWLQTWDKICSAYKAWSSNGKSSGWLLMTEDQATLRKWLGAQVGPKPTVPLEITSFVELSIEALNERERELQAKRRGRIVRD